MLHGNMIKPRIPIVRQAENWQWGPKGEKFYDAQGGAATACLGYNNSRLSQALFAQLGSSVGICNDRGLSTSVAEAFAQELIDSTDGKLSRAYICTSGESSSASRPPGYV